MIKGFDILCDYAKRSRSCAQGLPQSQAVQSYWTGVGFSLGKQRYVVPMGEVSEILTLPKLTKVPGVKYWVKGIANVRGRLLPVVDLVGFFGNASTKIDSRRRLMIVEREEMYSGIIVDDVLGMQHFPVQNYQQSVKAHGDDYFRAHLVGTYWREPVSEHSNSARDVKTTDQWPIFSFHRLAQNPDFLQFSG